MPFLSIQQIPSIVDVILGHFVIADELLKTQKGETARSDVEMRRQTEDDH